MGLLKTIDNIDILCSDVDAMYRFYHEVLELPLVYPYVPEERWFAVRCGHVDLYFFPGVGEHAPRFAADSDENPPSIESLSFIVDDLDEAIAELTGKVEWAGGIQQWEHTDGSWFRFRPFYDPEGNKLYVSEPHPVGGAARGRG